MFIASVNKFAAVILEGSYLVRNDSVALPEEVLKFADKGAV